MTIWRNGSFECSFDVCDLVQQIMYLYTAIKLYLRDLYGVDFEFNFEFLICSFFFVLLLLLLLLIKRNEDFNLVI